MADPALQIRPDLRRELLRLITTHLPHEEVWAFGSRVNGTAHAASDLDLVVRHPADLNVRQGSGFWELKEAFSESNLPFLVDLLDWAALPPTFWPSISEHHVVLYRPDPDAQSVQRGHAASGSAESA
ncbi:MAG: nucleotidyltransferase domain-containing protein [Opitutus sp.]|nr:nucleotidyltransferase domain-containing protein [Opitutus sp.]